MFDGDKIYLMNIDYSDNINIMNIKQLRLVYSIHLFLNYLPLGIYFPISTLFLLEKGYSLGWIGTAMSIFSITIFLFELPTGGFADKYGRINIYRISRVIYIFSLLILLFFNTLFSLFFSMFLYGVARALSSGTMEAWFVDMHDTVDSKINLSKSMSIVAGVAPAALGISTLLGGFIPDLKIKMNFFNLQGSYNFNIVIAISAVLIHLILNIIFFKETKRQSHKETINEYCKNIVSFLNQSNSLKYLIAISFCLGIGLNSIESFWQPKVQELAPNSPTFVLGVLASCYFFAATVGSLFSNILTNYLGEKKTLFLMKLFHGITLIALSYSASLVGFSIGFVTIFIFHGALNGPHQTLLHNCIPNQYRSSFLSVDSLSLQLGGGLSALILGWVAQYNSISLVWKLAGVFIIISAFLYLPIKQSKGESCESSI